MGTFLFFACVLFCLIGWYPDTIGAFFENIWNFFGSIVMFFVGGFAKIGSVFGFIGDICEWLIIKLGVVLEPVTEAIPDSPVIPLMACVVLGMLFFLLKKPGDELNKGNIDHYVRLTYAWIATSVSLGVFAAGVGNPLGSLSGFISSNASKPPMTLSNYGEWTDFARNMLSMTLIGGLISSSIFAMEKGLRSFIRTWVGLAFCGMLGYEYMSIRLVVTHWMVETLGFIGSMINIPIGFLEFFIPMQVFFGFVAFLLPAEAIAAIGGIFVSDGNNATPVKPENPFDDIKPSSGDSYPTYVKDDNNNTYSVSIDGDFLYINLPSGRISTKWEYIKNQSRFQVEGKWFHTD